MPKGYMGKILWVDLTKRTFTEETVPDAMYQKFLSGYGLASKLIFDRQKPGVDPLGPENILAFMSGLLTNTPAHFNGRWMVCAKSPLTGTWGDANSGGTLAPALKETGYDGIFFTGQSTKPVYLLITGDDKQILDAGDLWGKDTYETEETLMQRHGKNFRVASIGQGGENLSLISGIVNDKGRIAARSGLGAVMGSKKLKAICLAGKKQVEVADRPTMIQLSKQFGDEFGKYTRPWLWRLMGWMINSPLMSWPVRFLINNNIIHQPEEFNKYVMERWGTAGIASFAANLGDSPVKNWKGAGCADFPTKKARYISNDYVTQYEDRKYKCIGCPLGCGGIMKVTDGPYPIEETHKPEYETLCGFGTMLLANDVQRIIKVNDMLNRAGIDTISCSVVVSWAFEAYEKKVLKPEDMDGLTLEWGDAEAVIDLVRKIIYAEGIGQILKDGVKRTAEAFGAEATAIAMHVNGQELPMHDCRSEANGTGLGVAYEAEPTPGRHTSTLGGVASEYRGQDANERKKKYRLHTFHSHCTDGDDGDDLRDASCFMDLVNGLGLCAFAWGNGVTPPIVDWANAATGWKFTFEDYMKIAHRIKTVRHSFNIREGVSPAQIKLPKRAAGNPPLKKGPNKGKDWTEDFAQSKRNFFLAMGWNPETGQPLPEMLDELGLSDVKAALYAQNDKKEKISV